MRGFTGVSGGQCGVLEGEETVEREEKKDKKFLRAIWGARNMYFRRFTHG